jgi:hypothetical protein
VVKGKNEDKEERSGTLALKAPNLTDELFKLELENVGIVRIQPDQTGDSVQVLSRWKVELYVEAITIAKTAAPAAAPAARGEAQPGGPDLATLGALLNLLGRDRAPGTVASAVLLANGPAPELVAGRLLATAGARRPQATTPLLRSEGVAAGEDWARRTASLDELEALVAAADGDWTALSLEDDHSLAEQLRDTGALSADSGAVVIERDEFLEGVVAGAPTSIATRSRISARRAPKSR